MCMCMYMHVYMCMYMHMYIAELARGLELHRTGGGGWRVSSRRELDQTKLDPSVE